MKTGRATAHWGMNSMTTVSWKTREMEICPHWFYLWARNFGESGDCSWPLLSASQGDTICWSCPEGPVVWDYQTSPLPTLSLYGETIDHLSYSHSPLRQVCTVLECLLWAPVKGAESAWLGHCGCLDLKTAMVALPTPLQRLVSRASPYPLRYGYYAIAEGRVWSDSTGFRDLCRNVCRPIRLQDEVFAVNEHLWCNTGETFSLLWRSMETGTIRT